MTGYTPTDLAEDWEFKILRSSTGAFKNPDTLRRFLAEEERAGWVLLEKFDSRRVRLKRPAAAKSGDATLGFDPYRTTVGITDSQLTLIIMGCALGAVAIMIAIILIVTKK